MKKLKNILLLVLCCTHILTVFGQSEKTLKLHRKAILADTHNDVISQVVLPGARMEDDLTSKAHTDIARMISGGLDVEMFSIFCDEKYGKGTAFAMANRQMDTLDNIISRHPEIFMKATSPADIKAAQKAGKIACMMGVEGGHMIEDRMDYLDSLYNRGARYMTLTWNNSTSWATSAKDETENTIPDIYLRRGFAKADRGLDSFGVAVVKRMEALGMMVDISHVGEATFSHVLKIATKPVIASHSSIYAFSPHRRNLKDFQLKAIKQNNGVVFINFDAGFLDSAYTTRMDTYMQKHQSERDSLRKTGMEWSGIKDWLAKTYPEETGALRPTLSLLIDHIDYVVKMIGINHVGFGSDFDGIGDPPQGINGVQDFPKITQALIDRGYSKKDVGKILGGNFMRILKATSKG
jgi:membrane dipeptidase